MQTDARSQNWFSRLSGILQSQLGRRQLLTLFVVLIVPIFLLSVVLVVNARNSTEENELNELNAVATSNEIIITSYFSNLLESLSTITGSPEFNNLAINLVRNPDELSQEATEAFLAGYAGRGRAFNSIGIYAPDGRFLAGRGDENIINSTEVAALDVFIQGQAAATVGTPFYDRNRQEARVYITIPITDNLNDVKAVLLAVADIDRLQILLNNPLGIGESEDIYLISRDGYFLSEGLGREVEGQTGPSSSEAIDNLIDGRDGSGRYDDYRSPAFDVLGAYRWIPEYQIGIIVEVDTEEVLPSTGELILQVLPVVGISLVVVLILAIFTTNTFLRPILGLREGALRLAEGRLSERIPDLGRGEIADLGRTFNDMAGQIQDTVSSLEARVEARTRELALTLEVGRLATNLSTSSDLLPRLVGFIGEQFGLYYVQIYLLDEAKRYAILKAGTGDVGQQLLDRQHRLDTDQTSIVASVVQTRQSVLVSDTRTSDIHKTNPLLPDTLSEVSIPLLTGADILGVLDLQANTANRFNIDNLPVLEAMANQIAAVISSAEAFDEALAAIERADQLNRRLVRDNWDGYLTNIARQERIGYSYDLETPRSLEETSPTLPALASNNHVSPIALGKEAIGSIMVAEDQTREWRPEELAFVEDVAQRIAQTIEQFRLFDETERRASELQTVANVSAASASILDVQELLQTVVDLTQESFDLYHAHAYLYDEKTNQLVLTAGAGEIGRQMVARHHQIRFNHPRSLVAKAAREGAGVIVNNVYQIPDFLPNPSLPLTQSELAVPMFVGEELIGVLDVQSDRIGRFTPNDLRINTTLADQLAVAVKNARAFEVVETARQEVERVFNSSIDMIGTANTQGYFISLNPAWEKTLGWSIQELLSNPFINFVHPDDVEYTINTAGRIYQGEDTVSFENRYRTKSGEYRWIAWNTTSDVPNQLIYFVARDVTEQKAQQTAIQEQARRLALLNAMNERLAQAQTETDVYNVAASTITEILHDERSSITLLNSEKTGLAVYAFQGETGMVPMGSTLPLAKTATGTCVREGRIMLMNDIQADTGDYVDVGMMAKQGLGTILNVPLNVSGEIIGSINVASKRVAAFDERDIAIVQQFAVLLGARIENIRAFNTVETARQELVVQQEILVKERALLRNLIDSIPDLIFYKDIHGVYLGCNIAFERFAGFREEELIGKTDHFMFPAEVADFFREQDRIMIANGETRTNEEWVTYPDGRRVLLQTLKTPFKAIDGTAFGLIGISRDITEQQIAQEEIRRQSALVNAAQDFIAIADVNTYKVIYINSGGLRLVNYELEEALGKAIADYHSPEGAQKVIQEALPQILRGEFWRGENDLKRKDGTVFPVDQTLFVTYDSQGNPQGIATIMTDITQRKRSEEQILKRAIELQTVAEVGSEVTSELNIEKLLWDVSNLTKERFGLYHAHIYLLDEAEEALVLRAGAGDAGRQMVADGRRIALSHSRSLVARAGQTLEGVIANDVTTSPEFLPNPLLPNTRSELAVPIIAANRLLGVLDVQSAAVNRFTQEDIGILGTLASQIATAIQNARAFEVAQNAQDETNLLYEISTLINEADNEQTIINALMLKLGDKNLNSIALSIFDQEDFAKSTSLTTIADWRQDGTTRVGLVIANKAYPFMGFLSPDKATFVDDIQNHPEMDDDTRQLLFGLGVGAVVLIPLTIGIRWMGLLSFSYEQPRVHTAREERIMPSIAELTSNAVERFSLARQTAKRASELATVAELSATTNTLLNLDELLQEVVELTKSRFNLYHAHIYLLDESGEYLTLAAGAGEAGRIMKTEKRRIPVRRTNSIVAKAARENRGVVVNDVNQDPNFLPNPHLFDTKSEMALPIHLGDTVIGVLDVQSDKANRFTDEDVQIKTILAEQIAIAIQNARLYAEQVQYVDQLLELDRLKGEFLASMSHELRTPLNSIIGYAEVMLDGIDGELTLDMQEDVQAIHSSGKLLLSLINDILDLAKIEARQMELDFSSIDLTTFLPEIAGPIEVLLKEKPVQLEFSLDGTNNKHRMVRADERRLQQIMNNLLSNAAKFTEEGFIRVAVEYNADHVCVAVMDTGLGIPDEKQEVVFDRFRQADMSSTRKKGGTGLGLAITKELVEMHGGQIWLESEYGKGSTFFFTLPYATNSE